jgi:hypothetical protein
MAWTPARTPWVLSVGVVVLAACCLALASPSAASSSQTQEVPDVVERTLGEGVELGANGLYRAPEASGEPLLSHGPDTVRELAADQTTAGLAPGDPERPPTCATDYYQHVIYARDEDAPDRYSDATPEIAAAMRRSNAVLNAASLASGGGTADYKVLCDAAGEIQLDEVVTDGATLPDVVDALRDEGYDDPGADYTVFFDGSVGNACGVASFVPDDRLAADNSNNVGGGYAVVYQGCWFTEGPMHESAHNQGAVQYGAPNSTGTGGHCYDELDVLCYSPDGGDLHQEGIVPRCTDRIQFDCGADDYFDTAPEPDEYLATHWNLGSPLNRFIALGEAPAGVEPSDRLREGKFRFGSAAVVDGWRRYWIRVPRDAKALSVDVRSTPCELACDTDLDLFVQQGGEPTEQSYGCRSANPGLGERCTVRRPGHGRWHVGVRTSSGGPGASFKVKASVSRDR